MLDEDLLDRDGLERGTLLGGGRYEVLHRLGRGGVATVYRARNREVAADVALKILAEDRANDPEALVRFGNEVSLAANLPAHPNIVRPFEMGRFAELGGRPYMSMEYVRGPTLADLVMVKPLELVRACRLVLDVTDALVFLHGRGIVHRDVKPSNVIVGREDGVERARLLDFGYAFDIRAFESGSGGRLTQVDHRPGTKHYMAPEQARGAFPAPSFDLYALAVTLYHVLIGNPPLHNRTPREVVLRKVDESKPSFSIKGLREGLPAELEELVDHGLEREPGRRIASALEFRARLAWVLEAIDPGSVGERVAASAVGVAAHGRSSGLERPAISMGPGTAAAHLDATVLAPLRPSVLRGPRPAGVGRGFWLRVGLAAIATVALVSVVMILIHPSARGTTTPEAPVQSLHASEAARPEPEPSAAMARTQTSGEARPEPEVTPPTPDPETKATPEPEAEPSEPPPVAEAKAPSVEEPRPRKPAPTVAQPSCEQVRDEATAARRDKAAAELVRLTKRRGCWPDNDARLRLRVYALHQLGRYQQCAAMQDESADPEVQRTAKACHALLLEENRP